MQGVRHFGIEVTFSFVFAALLFSIVRIVTVHYGDMVITRITTRPYKIALTLLVFSCLDLCNQMFVADVVAGNDSKIARHYAEHTTWFVIAEDILLAFKYALAIVFVLQRAFEHGILLFFIRYQQSFTLQNLEIAKDKYQRLERRLSCVFYVFCGIVCLPNLVFNVYLISSTFTDRVESAQLERNFILYFVGMWVTATAIYSCIMINLMVNMYKFHRFEFNVHIKRMLLLYTATMASSVFVIGYTVFNYYYLSCVYGVVFGHPPTFDFWDPRHPHVGICGDINSFMYH